MSGSNQSAWLVAEVISVRVHGQSAASDSLLKKKNQTYIYINKLICINPLYKSHEWCARK